MKNTKISVKATVAIVLILLTASVTLVADVSVPPVQAQNASWYTNQSITPPAGITVNFTTDTISFLSFNPNVLGVGQTMLINMWITPSVNTGRGIFNNKTKAYQIFITKPDGTKLTITPLYNTLSEMTAWTTYTPDAVGVYMIQFNFQGTYFPPQFSANDDQYFRPSQSPVGNFTVQQEPVPSFPPSPLPTDYWTYPVDFIHREWWLIMGAWPGTGYNGVEMGDYWNMLYPDTNPTFVNKAMFTPFVQGPNTGHVVWNRQEAMGGLYGGPAGFIGQYGSPPIPNVVYHGRCYVTATRLKTVLVNGTYRELPTSCSECYDLRTGQIFWDIPIADGGVVPMWIAYSKTAQPESEVPNYAPLLQAWTSGANARLYNIDPFTGAITMNVSIANLPGIGAALSYGGIGTASPGPMNQIGGYVIGVQDLGAAAANATGGRYRLINWTTATTSTNDVSRVITNTSYSRSSLPTNPPPDWGSGYGVVLTSLANSGTGYATNVTGINAYTGATVWSSLVPYLTYDPMAQICDHGMYSMWTRPGDTNSEGGKQITWDLATGKLVWKSETLSYPFAAAGFSVYGAGSAYGLLFRPTYSGLYAINWTNGKTEWFRPRYAKAAFEGPYTESLGGGSVYPGQTQVQIADGKVYIYDGEHSPSQPRYRGWSLYCINATTGDIIWEYPVNGATMFSTPPSIGPIVDGYLLMPATTGEMYCFGKGKTATTVTAPKTAISKGTSVLIEGTVLDQSPAQPNTPCVSKDSMRTQMSYLHLAYPIAGIWGNETITGVPVRLTAIDQNGTAYDLGTTTSNGYTGVFNLAWTPTAEGEYEILASFGPNDSYGSSSASTGVLVGPAPTTGNNNNQSGTGNVAVTDYTMTIIGVGIAVIIAVAIAVAIAILVLRKR